MKQYSELLTVCIHSWVQFHCLVFRKLSDPVIVVTRMSYYRQFKV